MEANQIIPFSYGDSLIRTVSGENGEPFLVAKDVCSVLGYKEVSKQIKMRMQH